MHKEWLLIFGPGIREEFTGVNENSIREIYQDFEVDFCRLAWKKGQSVDFLVKQLETRVHQGIAEGKKVALVLSSATPSVAVNSNVWSDIEKAVFISGRVRGWNKFNPAGWIAGWRNNLYYQSVQGCGANLSKAKLNSVLT